MNHQTLGPEGKVLEDAIFVRRDSSDIVVFGSALRDVESNIIHLLDVVNEYAYDITRHMGINCVLLIYEDGSSDNTDELLQNYLDKLTNFVSVYRIPSVSYPYASSWYKESKWPQLRNGQDCPKENKNC